MKKIIIFLSLIISFGIISVNSFSQEKNGEKRQIKPALLVIDVQNAYLKSMDQREKDKVMQNINYYIYSFRVHGCPVIRVYHYNKQYGPEQGTEMFEFPSSVLIEPGDPKVIKTYPDAFNKTDLDKILKEKGVNTVFLCGLSSVGCVLATWIGAQNNDYKAFLIKNAIMSHNADYTGNVETMFDAVGYEIVSLILDNM
ncbi:MAG: isochorismatase family protein [Bacteroidales bacterium]|nr:isochorismatase family protein [Bacteroidales bacterium]MDD4108259.1 isochorismatase family protein [Prolixibacteraceae bacterium]MDD4639547.1 isochorismatase family protein [Bacteroidales bacterium]